MFFFSENKLSTAYFFRGKGISCCIFPTIGKRCIWTKSIILDKIYTVTKIYLGGIQKISGKISKQQKYLGSVYFFAIVAIK